MELQFQTPDVEGGGEFMIHKPSVELLIRWHDGGPARARGKIVSAKPFPHPGWGRSELDGRRLCRLSGPGDAALTLEGRVLDLDAMAPDIVRAIDAGLNPTLLPRELCWGAGA